MRKSKKALGLMLTAAMTASMFAGCGGGNDDANPTPTTSGNQGGDTNVTQTPVPDGEGNGDDANSGQEPSGSEPAKEPLYKSLDPNTSGTIDIMVWSGDSVYYEDIGKKTWEASEITTQNVAAIYAMAKEFNKMYPNVKINLWAKTDDPNGNDTTWAQEMENFRAEHGKYPDIYASNDLIGDTSKGLVADLSVFADDVLYQSFNKAVMATMSYYGFQAALPQFIQPWGVYVNKELAETNNIEVPSPQWTIDEYTELPARTPSARRWQITPARVTASISHPMRWRICFLTYRSGRTRRSGYRTVLATFLPKSWMTAGGGATASSAAITA